jgi:hypothetical protein
VLIEGNMYVDSTIIVKMHETIRQNYSILVSKERITVFLDDGITTYSITGLMMKPKNLHTVSTHILIVYVRINTRIECLINTQVACHSFFQLVATHTI